MYSYIRKKREEMKEERTEPRATRVQDTTKGERPSRSETEKEEGGSGRVSGFSI